MCLRDCCQFRDDVESGVAEVSGGQSFAGAAFDVRAGLVLSGQEAGRESEVREDADVVVGGDLGKFGSYDLRCTRL